MEGIGYILIYLLKGELPWQGIKAQTKHEKQQVIMEKKMSTTTELLCHGLPNEFQLYMQMVMDLGFEEKPNYDFHKQQFNSLLKRMGYSSKDQTPVLDWVTLKKVTIDLNKGMYR